MNSEPLQPNIELLQQDVIDLLGRVSNLMGHASTTLAAENASEKYAQFQQEVDQAGENVKDLALRMAIVAPMKAGKSTIINAIIGNELLPSRNSAMTTLPTEIVFDADRAEPVLILSHQIYQIFQETLSALQDRINNLREQERENIITQYPHLKNLLEKIKIQGKILITQETIGRENILNTLASLNDIIRLASAIDPAIDPLYRLIEVPRIYTPFWHSQTQNPSSKLGNLVITDTPGPNEAGENLRLTNVVREQLRKSSIVLIVLDFTQLKTEAAEKVKKDVQQVIQIRGIENLYVVINKVDQRRDGDMTPEDVRKFVIAELGLKDKNKVFEIAARWAFSAANFMFELQQNSDLKLTEMASARALAQETLGARWEAQLMKKTVEDLQSEAEYLWQDSGFSPFLEKAINALMQRVAPECMNIALNIACECLQKVHDDVKFRSRAINENEEKLRIEIGALEEDLRSLDVKRNQLRQVEKIKNKIKKELDQLLVRLKKEATVNLESFFNEEEYQRAGLLKKATIGFNKLRNIIQAKNPNRGNGIIEFPTYDEAEDFAKLAVSYPKLKAENTLENFRQQIIASIESSSYDLINELEKNTKPIIEKAHHRLNENFSLDLSLPKPKFASVKIDFSKPSIQSSSKTIYQGYEKIKKRRFWHWVWLVPYEEFVERPQKKVSYYTVSLMEVIKIINSSIEKSIEKLHKEINEYVDEMFQKEINVFFKDLDNYLSKYKDTLEQAQLDKKCSEQEQLELTNMLNNIGEKASSLLKEINDKLIKRTKQLIDQELKNK